VQTVKNIAPTFGGINLEDISDYGCDADDLLLIPIIIPQFDLQAELPYLDSEYSTGEETGKDITGTYI
jgi:hypothetical protein